MNRYLLKLTGVACWAAIIVCPVAGDDQWRYPSSERKWGPEDYTQVQNTFYFAHLALPHRRAPEPKKLFERLVDWKNIETVLSDSRDSAEVERKLRIILAATGAIRADYSLSVLAGEPLQDELVDMQIFDLNLSGLVTHWTNPSLTATADTVAAKTRFQGVMHSISESNIYTEHQIAELSTAAAYWFDSFQQLFSKLERSRLYGHVEKVMRGLKSTEAHSALKHLLNSIGS